MADRTEIQRPSPIPTSDCDVVYTYNEDLDTSSSTKKQFADKNEASACAAAKGKDYYVESNRVTVDYEASEVTSSSAGSRPRVISSTFYYVSKKAVAQAAAASTTAAGSEPVNMGHFEP